MTLLSRVQKLDYDRDTDDKKKGVEAFAFGKEVFVSLLNGSGKSLCYTCLPHVLMNCESELKRLWSTIGHSIVVERV